MKISFIKVILFLIFLIQVHQSHAQSVSGFVYDAQSREALISALVVSETSSAYTDSDGHFTVEAMDGENLIISYLGYDSDTISISNNHLKIYLHQADNLLREVVIGASNINMKERSQTGLLTLNKAQLENRPSLVGEADPIKGLQLLPGVTFGTEGTSSIYVRGGSSGQNLLLVEDIPLYNANHGFGFFSTIPTSAIKQLDLYKSGFPAQYGNRLSSVIDIQMSDGNKNEHKTSLALSTIAAKIHQQGPIIKDKLSYSGSLRYSLTGLFTDFSFYDGTLKLHYLVNDKNHIDFFGLYSGDTYDHSVYEPNTEVTDHTLINWNNKLAGLSWKHFLNNKAVLGLRGYVSNYDIESRDERTATLGDVSNIDAFFTSDILEVGAKAFANIYFDDQTQLDFGVGLSRFDSAPETSTYTEYLEPDTLISYRSEQERQRADLIYGYVQLEKEVGNWAVHLGARANYYISDRSDDFSIEPRVALSYNLPNDHMIKASYTLMNQYNHFVTNGNLGSPSDSWIIADDRLLPSRSWQSALGFYPNIRSKKWNYITEVYYKNITNDVRAEPGYIALEDNIYDRLAQVDGRAYGWEHSVSFLTDRWSFDANYTWSKSERKFVDTHEFGNDYFPFRYDRRHELSILGSYLLSQKKKNGKVIKNSISADWVYTSGAHYTIDDIIIYNPGLITDPLDYNANPRIITTYPSSINNVQAPAFHRLNIVYSREIKRSGRTSIFKAGLYNAYNRKNVFILQSDRQSFDYPSTGEEIANYDKLNTYISTNKNTVYPILPFIAYEVHF